MHDGSVKGNKGYKYTSVIAPLLAGRSIAKTGVGLPLPPLMRVTSNAIDYVHWDDPNELVDRLRLIEASRAAGNN